MNNIMSPSLWGYRSWSAQLKNTGQPEEWMGKASNTSLPHRIVGNALCSFRTTGHIYTFGENGLLAILGLPCWPGMPDTTTGNAAALCQAFVKEYHQQGESFLKSLWGEYLFVLVDDSEDIVLAGVDRMSRYPLYWSTLASGLVLGSSASAVLACPEVAVNLSNQGIYNYVYSHMIPSPSTVYEGVKKLSAGELLIADKDKIRIRNLSIPVFKNSSTQQFSKAGAQLRELLRKSLRKSLDSSRRTGAFLSGGLDSSTVVGMLAEIGEGEQEAFAIGFNAEGYDEVPYARITAKHFGVKLHEYYVTPDDVVEALPKVATSYDEPFGNSSALPAYFCAKFAKDHGIERLLAGDGGDELFAGNERYAKQSIFEAYGSLPKWLRTNVLEPAFGLTTDKLYLFRKINSYIRQANVSLPDRLQINNYTNLHSPSELFTDEFLQAVNVSYPEAYYREVYSLPKDASKLNRMLYLDWQYTLADNDLRKVSHMCAVAGIEVAYPMIDDELIEFSCTLPDRWKLKGQKLRYFYKEALRGWLPDATINKKKHGFGLPFGIWMSTHKSLQELAYDSLNSLKKRGYFKPEFIDKVISMHRERHVVYYGELVWILTVLELWLSEHAPEID
ncbi:asparagine synthetase B family protein [Sedimenticola hydrogenitrophicus]|uniref:asparagine synthetase B family protein n=1 Tax=Sedimenticola hydrogenitrophicus TaxID=2967975 RepID=UPI0023AFF1B4|nr:asparagine synthase C-terminal domain-containing protein [Sedimenticola hydrogenitrophicus]